MLFLFAFASDETDDVPEKISLYKQATEQPTEESGDGNALTWRYVKGLKLYSITCGADISAVH